MSVQEIFKKTISDETLLNWAKDYASFHSNRIAWDADYVLGLGDCGKILNIGGAPYIFEYLACNNPNISITTLDLEPGRFSDLINTMGIDVRKFDIEHDNFINLKDDIGHIDVVLLCEVFEHLRIDIIATLKGIHSIIKDGGLLYLTTPNGLSLLAMLRIFMSRRTGPNPVVEWRKIRDLGHMGHVREYSMKEVCQMLTYCGFSIEKKFYRNLRFGKSLKGRIYYYLCLAIPFFSREVVILARKQQ